MPPVGAFLYSGRFPSNRLWQCARAAVHIRSNSSVTTNSVLSSPYGSTATSSAG